MRFIAASWTLSISCPPTLNSACAKVYGNSTFGTVGALPNDVLGADSEPYETSAEQSTVPPTDAEIFKEFTRHPLNVLLTSALAPFTAASI